MFRPYDKSGGHSFATSGLLSKAHRGEAVPKVSLQYFEGEGRIHMKKVIVISVAILLVISGVAIAALYYIGDKMVNTLMDSEINAILDEKPIASSSSEPSATSASSESPETTPSPESSGTTSIDRSNQNVAIGNETDTLDNTDETEKAKEEAKSPVKNPAGQNTTPQPNKQKPIGKSNYTIDEMKKAKEDVTATDKISSAALLIKRLSSDDLNELKNMLPGGVNEKEKKRAKEIVYLRFTAEEVKTIWNMYMKYMYD